MNNENNVMIEVDKKESFIQKIVSGTKRNGKKIAKVIVIAGVTTGAYVLGMKHGQNLIPNCDIETVVDEFVEI